MTPTREQNRYLLSLPRPTQQRLLDELSDTLKQTQIALLRRFAKSPRNHLRTTIILFRSLLSEIISWADAIDFMEELAAHARWWESYWYEKEYMDSEFSDLTDAEQRTLSETRSAFYRNHIELWFPIIDLDSLERELLLAAADPNIAIPSLSRLTPLADWGDLAYCVQKSSPTVREIILDFAARCALKASPATYTEDFIDFLRRHTDAFTIDWSIDYPQVCISIHTSSLTGTVYGNQLIDRPSWAINRARATTNSEVDAQMEEESKSDIGDLFDFLENRRTA